MPGVEWRSGSAPLPGYECVEEWVVGEEHAAAHLKERGILTLSTPSLLLMAEATVRRCMDNLLAEGYTTVGVEALIKHRRPAHVGSKLTVRGLLVSVDGARLSFHIKVLRGSTLIGEVYHERRIVSSQEFAERVKR